MGVPAFYRWLATKYPKCISPVVYEKDQASNLSNPNGVEWDNLYLDMNGIIHPCCHPEDKDPPETEDDMFAAIFEYIDMLFTIIRPRKVLFMAIDGVAPRAKMNQQRSRRFKAAKDAQEQAALLAQEEDARTLIAGEKKAKFDSNVITPGTPFMFRLAQALEWYIVHNLNTNPGWSGITVFLSDANCPGEGEHKIVDYVRQTRLHDSYDANTKHVIYGLDADLIMLSLATHEPHFWVLREQITGRNKRSSDAFETVDICIFREYLRLELQKPFNMAFDYDFERVIDDFIFICFFVGNDFLPHLPSMEIREGAVDKLLDLYITFLPFLRGYLTDNGDVHLGRCERFLSEVARIEEDVFRRRIQKKEREEEQKRQREAQKIQQKALEVLPKNASDSAKDGENKDQAELLRSLLRQHMKQKTEPTESDGTSAVGQPSSSDGSADVAGKAEPALEGSTTQEDEAPPAKKRKLESGDHDSSAEMDSKEVDLKEEVEPEVEPEAETLAGADDEEVPPEIEEVIEQVVPKVDKKQALMEKLKALNYVGDSCPDQVLFGVPGWRERYYERKFHLDYRKDTKQTEHIFKCYMEGLCWVLQYYYHGCVSWGWYYPYHYAPLASDLTNVSTYKISFERGEPFTPLEQLMSVFPIYSNHAIPYPLRRLMEDESSPIRDYYPTEFEVDYEGKKFKWEGIALLPFIDQERLLSAVRPIEDTLPEPDKRRNARKPTVFYRNKIFNQKHHGETAEPVEIDDPLPDVLKIIGDRSKVNEYLARMSKFVYDVPEAERKVHVPRLLPGVQVPEGLLVDQDLDTREFVIRRDQRSRLEQRFGNRFGGSRYDDRRGDRRDDRGDYRNDNRYDNRYDNRNDNRNDNRYDNRYDNRGAADDRSDQRYSFNQRNRDDRYEPGQRRDDRDRDRDYRNYRDRRDDRRDDGRRGDWRNDDRGDGRSRYNGPPPPLNPPPMPPHFAGPAYGGGGGYGQFQGYGHHAPQGHYGHGPAAAPAYSHAQTHGGHAHSYGPPPPRHEVPRGAYPPAPVALPVPLHGPAYGNAPPPPLVLQGPAYGNAPPPPAPVHGAAYHSGPAYRGSGGPPMARAPPLQHPPPAHGPPPGAYPPQHPAYGGRPGNPVHSGPARPYRPGQGRDAPYEPRQDRSDDRRR